MWKHRLNPVVFNLYPRSGEKGRRRKRRRASHVGRSGGCGEKNSGDTLDPLKKSAGKMQIHFNKSRKHSINRFKKETNKKAVVVVTLSNIHTC